MLPTFPDFAPLKLEDKEMYNQLVTDHPPSSDISFGTLQVWWNLEGQLTVASLNGNLVIHYSQSFDPEQAGYCLVGKQLVDRSIETIFEYLRKEHRAIRLIHVPEFTVKALSNSQGFEIEEEPDYNEYILDSQALAELPGSQFSHVRNQISRFLRETEGKQVETKSLDLTDPVTQQLIMQSIKDWEKSHPPKNDPTNDEHQALMRTLTNAKVLDIHNLSLYIDGKLHGIVLHQKSLTEEHYIISHLRVNYDIPYVTDYLTNSLAKQAIGKKIPYINMEMDLGIENLRRHKMKLQPVDFFRKYTIKPRALG